jgi:hypothetical protein
MDLLNPPKFGKSLHVFAGFDKKWNYFNGNVAM